MKIFKTYAIRSEKYFYEIKKSYCFLHIYTGTELQITNINLSTNFEKWKFINILECDNTTNLIYNVETNRLAAPYGPYFADGTRIHQWNFSTSNSRKWLFTKETDYFYSIKNLYTNKYIGIKEDTNGHIYVEQYSSNSDDCTRWRVYKNSTYIEDNINLILVPKGYEPYVYALSVDPMYNNNGSILEIVSYTNNNNYKDEWLFFSGSYFGSMSTAWHSDAISIGYREVDSDSSIIIYPYKLNDNYEFSFGMGWNNAINQWKNALNINITYQYSSSGADITMYGGTQSQIEDIYGGSFSSWNGLTVYYPNYIGYTNLNNGNTLKKVFEFDYTTTIYIKENYNQNCLCKTITHELGHALGYSGHAPNSTDVMYAYGHSSYMLKEAEKNHLNNAYLLLN